jgi:lysozyme
MIEALALLVAMVQRFEGLRLVAYQDIVGVWTIGYGETLGVHAGMVWTQQQAEDRLRERLAGYLLAVLKRCPQLHLEPPCMLAACTSLAYNIGTGAFGASSVCRLTKWREFIRAAASFLLWNRAGGRVIRGLALRRAAERLTYLQRYQLG